MNIIKYYYFVGKTALKHSYDITQTVIFILLILIGIAAYFYPALEQAVDMTSWEVTIFIFFSIIIICLLLAPYWIYKEQQIKLNELSTASPLEIIFDSTNPNRKFWSKDCPQYWVYRVLVKNTSSKTVKNVSVIVEHVGIFPQRPMLMESDLTKKDVLDINPGCEALIPILKCDPTPRPGMAAGPSALAYGPIKVIATGNDVLPTVSIFQFDYQKTPMIFQ